MRCVGSQPESPTLLPSASSLSRSWPAVSLATLQGLALKQDIGKLQKPSCMGQKREKDPSWPHSDAHSSPVCMQNVHVQRWPRVASSPIVLPGQLFPAAFSSPPRMTPTTKVSSSSKNPRPLPRPLLQSHTLGQHLAQCFAQSRFRELGGRRRKQEAGWMGQPTPSSLATSLTVTAHA